MNRVKQISIEKYFEALTKLHNTLSYTDRISMDEFCVENNLSKNMPRVLQRGGIIKCTRKGKYSLWEWTSIEPTKHMAVKCIQNLGIYNPPRKSQQLTLNVDEKANTDIKVVTRRRRKTVEPLPVKQKKNFLISMFWGFFKIEIC